MGRVGSGVPCMTESMVEVSPEDRSADRHYVGDTAVAEVPGQAETDSVLEKTAGSVDGRPLPFCLGSWS